MTHNDKRLRIFYQNVCSLKNKQTQFDALIQSQSYDVIALTETWLSPEMTEFLSMPISLGWSYIAKSRPHGTRGGGILLLIAPHLSITKESTSPNFEQCSLLLCTNPPIGISLIYNPPPAANTDWDTLLDSCLYPSLAKTPVILLGDFNDATWQKNNSINKLLPSSLEHDLTQIVPFPTRGENYLDLAFIRHLEVVNILQNNWFDSDHQGFELEIALANEPPKFNAHKWVNDYHRTNWKILNKQIFELHDELSTQMNVTETTIDNIIDKLNKTIADCIPKRKIKKNSLPWMDDELIALCNKKNRYHKIWKCKRSDVAYMKYAEIRSKFRNEIKKKKDNFMINNQSTYNTDPKKFWKIFKSPNSPGFKTHSTVLTASDFANHFENLSKRKDVVSSPPGQDTNYRPNTLNAISITPALINQIVNQNSFHTKSSPDALNGRVLKACAQSLSTLLCVLMTHCLELGYYPRAWKKSLILPLYKKNDKDSVTNYRQITIQPLAGKLLDKLIYESLYHHVSPMVNTHVHYGIKFRSVNTNLLETTAYILEALENKNMVDIVYADFEKAFDNIAHNLLLYKLEYQFGIVGQVLKLFTSYFKDRMAFVSWNDECSSPFQISQGIPQGGILSPLLFTLFTNDIPLLTNCKLITYADDVKILHAKPYSSYQVDTLQFAIDTLLSWSSKWGLSLNPDKTKFMEISLRTKTSSTRSEPNLCINRIPIEQVTSFKDLGVIFNTTFTFSNHISELNLNLRRTLGFLKFKYRAINNITTRKILYNALFQSKLDFGLILWAQAANSNIGIIERTHKRALEQFVLKNSPLESSDYHSACKLTEILPIKQRIWSLTIPLTFSPYYVFPAFFQPERAPERTSMITRSNTIYAIPSAKKAVTSRSLRTTLPKFLNSLPSELLPSIPLNQYWKKNFKSHALSSL